MYTRLLKLGRAGLPTIFFLFNGTYVLVLKIYYVIFLRIFILKFGAQKREFYVKYSITRNLVFTFYLKTQAERVSFVCYCVCASCILKFVEEFISFFPFILELMINQYFLFLIPKENRTLLNVATFENS